MCWSLWIIRNDRIFKRKSWTPEEVINHAQMACEEFGKLSQSLICTSQSLVESPSTDQRQWIPPPHGQVKLNTDAALPRGESNGGIGFIIRNDLGHSILAISDPVTMSNILMGKSMAVRAGLLVAVEAGVSHIMVESDCAALISYINGDDPAPLSIGSFIHDIRCLASQFTSIAFNHVSRDRNGVADFLARKALSSARRTIWLNSNPWLLDLCY
ncbi:uncharacterized protein LOC122659481 [Telopea speciosissima]|uniref:uncharacterized protein LOC122659481 n=1 Tax=Telopea speciosissima TaxID=54955 RepID=UPI001CC6C3D3|nr:uncharacterized protein LOC122659481 [Telopea speciosissima]